jgi:hypothetical protein
MIVVLLLSGMGAALIQLQAARTRQQVASIDNVRSLYIAEAGLSEAFLAVSEGKTGNVGAQSQPASFGDGYYWVEAAETNEGQVALVSNALCGVGRFSIALVLQREVNEVGALGMFGEESLRVGSGAVLDGFDSREGAFGDQVDADLPGATTGDGALVGSNGDIQIACTQPAPMPRRVGGPAPLPVSAVKTLVYGDVQPGPDSAVVMDPGSVVTGSTTPAAALSDLPMIDIPDVPPAGFSLFGSVTGDASYESLTVASGRRFTIRGPATLVIGAFVLQPSATLVFDASGGAIVVHCTQYLDFAPGSTLRSTVPDAKACALLISAPDGRDRTGDGRNDPAITLGSSGDFYSMIYAPSAALTVPAGLHVFGSIAAMSLDAEDGSRLTFDHSLATEGAGVEGLPAFISWHVVALPDSPLVDLRMNPGELLALNGITPIPSADAHMERTFEVQYLDLAGVPRTFTGAPKDLDWSLVRKLVSCIWYDRNGRRVDPFTWLRNTLDQPIVTTYDQLAVDGLLPNLLFSILKLR